MDFGDWRPCLFRSPLAEPREHRPWPSPASCTAPHAPRTHQHPPFLRLAAPLHMRARILRSMHRQCHILQGSNALLFGSMGLRAGHEYPPVVDNPHGSDITRLPLFRPRRTRPRPRRWQRSIRFISRKGLVNVASPTNAPACRPAPSSAPRAAVRPASRTSIGARSPRREASYLSSAPAKGPPFWWARQIPRSLLFHALIRSYFDCPWGPRKSSACTRAAPASTEVRQGAHRPI